MKLLRLIVTLAILVPVSAFSQAWPSHAATNSDLLQASDLAQSSLSSSLNSTSLTVNVVSASSFVPNSIITIDLEQIKVCSIAGLAITACSDGRGYGGTTAIGHNAGAKVSNYVSAAYHNLLRTEIQSIETWLNGLNGVVVGNGTTAPASQNPLTVPRGGIGSVNPGTGVMIANGTGPVTSESPLSVAHGGLGPSPSLVAGQGITITGSAPNQTISAASTIGADISVFIAAACTAYKEASIPAGTFTAQSTVTPATGCYIHGVGRGGGNNGATVINFIPTNTTFLNITQDNVHISGLTILQVGSASAGSVGIFQAGAGSGVVGAHGDWGIVEDVNIRNFWNGMKLMGSGGSFDLYRVEVDANRNDGIIALGSQGYWYSTLVTGNVGNGVTIGLAAAGGGIGPFQTNTQTFGNGGWGEISTSQLFISGGNSYFNNDFLGEIKLSSVPPQADSGYIKDAFVQFAGQSISFGTNNSAPGIFLAGGSISVVDNIHCFNNQGNCFTISGTRNLISHVIALGSGQGGVNTYSIQAGSGNNTVSDSYFGNPLLFSGNNNIIRGNTILCSQAIPSLQLASGTNYFVDGNNITNGTGNSFQLDAGVTANHGYNLLTGAFLNNGTVASAEVANF